ncbi:heat-shock protein Hsp90 [Tenacibaculum jejuense]|uniref:Heat-shock protein Hsp90 n=1 Tax=Tenacibaculum jejuense TaxID=584609 RepID=A0A238UAI8_9FLAO|nr:heat-shock protein Hsp90 [Tenacibaculum jejuense]SNR16191.1 Protein of unknown function precursor [Tenacibaculum jejuense]
MKKIFITLFLIVSITVSSQEKKENFIRKIEDTHKKVDFLNKKYLSYDISIQFGGKDYMKGTIMQETGGGKIKIIKESGAVIIFDGTNVYGKGITTKAKAGARFDIFTWSYFLGLPYKLKDSGTVWSEFKKNTWGGNDLDTGKLAFESGTGDAPDDWYIIYKTKDHVLEGAAYIVSFGKGKEAAEKEPHAVKYNSYKTIEGIPFSTNWTFHLWTIEQGYTDQIGEVSLSNIKFLDNIDFKIPEGSEIINAPK